MQRLILGIFFLLAALNICNSQDWNSSFETAKETANTENKVILLVFEGSDWCAPCIKMEHEIWNSEAFAKYATDKLVLLKADFPRRKKNALSEAQTAANAKLAEQYNQQGIFPFVVLLDKNGKVLGQTGYNKMKPEEYVIHLDNLCNK